MSLAARAATAAAASSIGHNEAARAGNGVGGAAAAGGGAKAQMAPYKAHALGYQQPEVADAAAATGSAEALAARRGLARLQAIAGH